MDFLVYILFLLNLVLPSKGNDIIGCGGFVKSHVNLDFSKIEIGLYTKEGSLKEKTECAPTNGYYFLPLYEKGEYVLKVHPPAGWSFEPSEVNLVIDGTTDKCSAGQDINFAFNGFGITGKVITAGQKQGPSGVSVQLIDEKGVTRNTVTSIGGDFHFTPVIPGKYTIKASHPRWTLDPSQAVVQVKEGNTVLSTGVLAVRGYDVKGSVTSYGSPVANVHILLYSKEESLKFRVEGCITALLQGVPDAPICYSITDSSGEFSFGLVPAGEYRLMALSKQPGQPKINYNVKPEFVSFSVLHDSLFIKNTFEVTGFTVKGKVVTTSSGPPMAGVRVLLDDKPVGNTDSEGYYTLTALKPGTYSVKFQHEQSELDPIQVQVSGNGQVSVPEASAGRWRVCGAVAPPASRDITITPERPSLIKTLVKSDGDKEGQWCTFLPSGVYMASVEVSETEHRDGLQYFPLSHKIGVAHAPVSGIVFSQLKATVQGQVACPEPAACASLRVTLRPLAPDGSYVGRPVVTSYVDGKYKFSEVLPGSVEVSVPTERLCWAEARHNVAVTAAAANVPPFHHTGYALRFLSSHAVQVEFNSGKDRGTLPVEAGTSQHCVPRAGRYTLTPRGCHRFSPETHTIQVEMDKETPPIQINALSHAVGVKVFSPEQVDDLILRVSSDRQAAADVGPLQAAPAAGQAGGYVYEHTLYLAQGEVAVVSARSSRLLFSPREPQQLTGGGECRPDALQLSAARALTLAGRIVPPVPDTDVTLTSEDGSVELSQRTGEDGAYRFGPLEAGRRYAVRAHKDSYAFSAPDHRGDIFAHRLAEITVLLLDAVDGKPLQGALVSVSGGSYRRNLQTGAGAGADGRLTFASLAPAEYYVKPLMKEYRFEPPHKIVAVEEGHTHSLTLRGVRVAWSALGSLVSVGGVGWAGGTLVATPQPAPAAPCAPEEATTDAAGAFRIRGLLPNCEYTVVLKDATAPELQGLRLAKTHTLKIEEPGKDIEDIRLVAVQSHQLTDSSVLVRAHIDHYRTLRLRLDLDEGAGAGAGAAAPLYSVRLDPAGYSATLNPGLMYVLPRLPADNRTYVLQLESTLSKTTHSYTEPTFTFTSDGRYKHFTIDFAPKVQSLEQELRQTSLLVIPLVALLALVVVYRDHLLGQLLLLGNSLAARAQQKATRPNRPEILDKNSIEQILNSVNAAGKRTGKQKKVQ